jgi:GNAT superfamily N-acetyltransferase
MTATKPAGRDPPRESEHLMITISIEDPGSADAHFLIEELSATLARITGASGKASFDPDDVRATKARFVVARNSDGDAVGCGAFRPLHDGMAEVKRMYARPGTIGVGSAILAFLESEARGFGYEALRLETRRVNERAINFYERRGYRRISNFGKYVGNAEAICLEKRFADVDLDRGTELQNEGDRSGPSP